MAMNDDTSRGTTAVPCVLLADDDRSIRRALSSCLGLQGYRVAVAADVESALGTLQTDSIDLVITDAHMPGDTRQIIRHAHEGSVRIPVVLYSSADDQLCRELAPLADAFVRKQEDAEALLRVVSHCLGRGRE